MRMIVDEAGQRETPLKIDHAGIGRYKFSNIVAGTDGDDTLASRGEGFGPRARFIAGPYATVYERKLRCDDGARHEGHYRRLIRVVNDRVSCYEQVKEEMQKERGQHYCGAPDRARDKGHIEPPVNK
jgi:hypothetical protein